MGLGDTPFIEAKGTVYNAREARRYQRALTSYRGGVFPKSNAFKVQATGTPGGTVDVLVGAAAVMAGSNTEAMGAYLPSSDGTVNVAVSPTSTLARKDIVILEVRDAEVTGSNNDERIFVVAGTANASPVDPSLAAFPNCIPLARITQPGSNSTITNAMITDLRPFTVATGGIVPCLSTDHPTTVWPGMEIFEIDTKRTMIYDGTSFRYYGSNLYGQTRRTSGNVSLAGTTAWKDVDTGMDITLPAAAGDVIEVAPSGAWGAEATVGYLDVATIVSAAPVHYFLATGGASDVPAPWLGGSGGVDKITGSAFYTLVAGDITGSGTVVLRLRARQSSATVKTIQAVTTLPFIFTARNLGPAV